MSNLPSIDSVALESVTGGKAPFHSGSNQAQLDALNSISSSLSSIKSQPQQGGLFNNPTNMALFAMALQQRNQNQQGNLVVVR